jgi:poly-D-alanine transfer protein DltD
MVFLKHHIFPLSLALIISFLLINSGKIDSVAKNQKVKSEIPAQTYFPYYTNDFNTELWLRSHLKNKSVVVIGSSELTAQTRKYIPNKFLTDSLGIPCIAFGKGGNQCFSIFCQLLSFNKNLAGSRIVIVLSPGWFDEYDKGTSAEMFLLYNNKRTLGYILDDDSIPTRFKTYIGKYVAHNLPSIDAPDETLMRFYYLSKQTNAIQSVATYPFSAFHSFCWKKRNSVFENAYADHELSYPVYFSETEKFLPVENPVSPEMKQVKWDSLCKVALADFNKSSDNNSSGIENEYFNTWIRGKALKKNKDFCPEKNTEYQDFLMLMDLLSYYKVNAYFMIQGLNPYAFQSPQKLDPVIDSLKTEIRKRNFEYFDMFTSDKSSYVKGTLNDIMHTGDYGWLKADSAFVNHYFNPAKK